jgi:hypothetical protein
MKTLTNCGDLTESCPESISILLTLLQVDWQVLGSRMCSVNWVSKSRFVRLLVGFSKPDMTVNILSASSAACRKGFQIHNRLTETRKKLSISGFSKDLHN